MSTQMSMENDLNKLAPGPEWIRIEDVGGPFVDLVGPVFETRDGLGAEEPIRYGMRILEHHCNMRMVCHGGMLATLMDFCLARGATEGLSIREGAPTMTLSVDYLSPASLGDWVESRVTLLRRSPRTAFMQAVLLGSKNPVLRGSAIYKLPKQMND